MTARKHILLTLTPEAFRRVLAWYSGWESSQPRTYPVDEKLAAMLASYAVRNGVQPESWWQGLFERNPEYQP